ncbi:MAG: hypothetical protein ABI836_03280 [Gemmatimonadota bacterium]
MVPALVALTFLFPGAARAQWKFAVIPYVAAYFPLRRLVDSAGFTEQQANAPLFGARLSYWIAREIAVEVGSGFTKSKIITETSGQISNGSVTNKQDGYLIFSSARLLYKPARSNFFGFLGGSITMRRGDAWPKQGFPKRDTFGGVAGFGARSEVTSSLSLWVSAEGHFYRANFDGDGPTGRYYGPTTQTDLIVTIGVPIALLNR